MRVLVLVEVIFLHCLIVVAGADEIGIMVPAFEGGPLGLNVATVLNLKIWRTLQVPPTRPQHPTIGGTVLWSVQTLPKNSHEEAERAARNSRAQIILWGNAVRLGDGVWVQAFLSIPEYEDLRTEFPEEWKVELPCNGSTIDLGVGVPRRRYEFSPIVLQKELVEQYTEPSSIRLFSTKGGKASVGELGRSFRAHKHDGDYTYVKPSSGKPGWIYLPRLNNEVEIINFAGGLVRLYRADYSGAIELFRKVSGSGAAISLKIDALLLEAIARAKKKEDSIPVIEAAIALNPHLQASVKFKVAALVSKYMASSRSPKLHAIAEELKRVTSENEYLFSSDDPWLAAAHRVSECISADSHGN